MPYRREHSCTVDEEVTENIEVVTKETSLGVFKFVKGMYPDGRLGLRAIRIPAHIPVSEGMRICNTLGGQFSPATPLNPKKQLLTEKFCIGCVYKLVEEFEMPSYGVELSEVVLPTSDKCYMLGHKHLPYKNVDGSVNPSLIRLSLSRLNSIEASSEVKLGALRKLLRLARVYGIKVEEKPHFKLEDLDFYLTILTEIEREEEDADSKTLKG